LAKIRDAKPPQKVISKEEFMKSHTKIKIIQSIKVFLAVLLSLLWIAIIYNISNSELDFAEQAPYCMGSTMLIFFSLNLAYKGLDYWLLRYKESKLSS
jgi:hypothetical protein